MFNPGRIFGLTPESSNDKIKEKVFELALDVGYMFFATISLDGKTPNSRGLEVHSLDDQGNLYIGMSRGKPVYNEIKRSHYVVGSISRSTPDHHAVGLRISAYVREVDDPGVMGRYWALNLGTKKLYRRDLDNFKVFVMERGEGEIFQVTAEEDTLRLRFSFGGEASRKPYYMITDKCTGCGACEEKCLTGAITPGPKYTITHFHCQECGNCYFYCPIGAVIREE